MIKKITSISYQFCIYVTYIYLFIHDKRRNKIALVDYVSYDFALTIDRKVKKKGFLITQNIVCKTLEINKFKI